MTDAKARLLQMIADEPHMGGGGLLKAVGKAQKAAKAAETGMRAILPAAEREANLAKMLADSAVKDRMYHGTAHYANTPEATDKLTSTGIKKFKKRSTGTFLSLDPELDEYTNTRGGPQGAVYPLYVQVKNPFDFENPKHIDALAGALRENPEGMKYLLSSQYDNWQTLEEPKIQRAIKGLGHDAYYTWEDGRKNLAVYDPAKIKSAIGNRGTYDLTDPDITKAGGGLLKAVSKAQKVSKAAEAGMKAILPAAEREANLAKMLEGSKVKERLYHGTGRDIKEFDKSKLRRTAFGEGFHLAESPNLANFYANQFDEGQNVMPVYAAIKNPYDLKNMHDWFDVPGDSNKDKTNFLKSQGYDGIKYPHGAGGDKTSPAPSVYVAFEPEQIKSAIGNQGTYDLTDPDITKAGGGLLKAVSKAQKAAKTGQEMSKVMQPIVSAAEHEANLARLLAPSKATMRLYHGTTATEGGKGTEAIRRLKPSKEGALGSGVYLTPSPAHASGYSGIPNDEAIELMLGNPSYQSTGMKALNQRNSGDVLPSQQGGNMLPVYAQIKNPLIIEGTHGDPMIEALTKLGMDEAQATKMVERAYETKGYIGKEVESRARAAGYDGLMQYRDGDLSEVVSYNPNAIKSAIGNRGTFDINEPDLSKATGGAVHMAGGGRTPKMPWERYDQPNKVAEMRAREINPVAGAVKKGADYATQLIDKGPSFADLMGNVVGAVPFVGPDLRKRMEASNISIPTDINLASNMPAENYEYGQPMQYRKPGISTTSVPTKDVLDAIKVSDLVGTPGLSNVAESIGYGQMPDPLDLLDAASVAGLGYGAVKAGAKGAKAAKQGALSAAKAAERFAEKKVPEVMERGGMGAQMLGAFGQNTQSNVIKGPGGNWISGSVEQALKPLKGALDTQEGRDELRQLREQVGNLPRYQEAERAYDNQDAMNQWIERNLTNYVKKQMATHDDPIRKLAEQGIVHMPPEQMGLNRYKANTHRATHGAERLGESDEAKAWEDATDVAMEPMYIRNLHPDYREPWMEKADPKTQIFTATNDMHAHYLGFDHIVDVLNEDLAAGRIRPEQLSKVSMEQAVRRTYEYDQEMAKKMRETQAKVTEGMPVHKEYPEGYKWVELKTPDYNKRPIEERKQMIAKLQKEAQEKGLNPEDYIVNYPKNQLEQALKYEGDTMGHCVGGYCPDVLEGRSRIFSLRDAKGEPHVTVEVQPSGKHPIGYTMKGGEDFPQDFRYENGRITPEQQQQIYQRAKQLFSPESTKDISNHRMDVFQQAANEVLGPQPDRIVQIKGKQNRAPKEDYLPFVQDFVKSGNWSDVGDIRNAGLIESNGRYFTEPEFVEAAKKYGVMGVQDVPWEVARQRHIDAGISEDEALLNWVEGLKEGRGRLNIPDEPQMAEGGEVKSFFEEKSAKQRLLDMIAKEPHMSGGGLLKAIGKAQKTAKQAKMYSAVDKAMEASKRGAGTGMEFANELAKTSGIKKAELIDRGIMVPSKEGPVLNPALTQLPKMSKQEFVSHLNEKYKPPGVKKITLGKVKFDELSDQDLYKEYVRIRGSEPEAYGERMSREDILDELSGVPDEYATKAKYNQYKLPGSENYREVLLTLPSVAEGKIVKSADGKYRFKGADGEVYGVGYATKAEAEDAQNSAGVAYRSSHFDEPNVLYHMRQTDRITPTYTKAQIDAIGQRMADAMGTKAENLGSGAPILMMQKGVISPVEAAQFAHAKGFRNMDIDMSPAQKRALHIEEIQSDWHQQGREKGYGKQNLEPLSAEEDAELIRLYDMRAGNRTAEQSIRMRQLNDRLNSMNGKSVGVPDAPFKKNWHEHAIKQALMDAAEGGYDQLLITPGAEQSKRYNLAKHVSDIRYDPYYKQLIATGQRGEAINKIAEPHELPSYVGKEVAEKLLQTPISQGMHKLSGLDLTTGGEGMVGFYDKMVPSYLNDLGKKYGVRVGEHAIEAEVPYTKTVPTLADIQRLAQEMYGVNDIQAISALPVEQRNALNQAFADRVKAEHTTKLHSFDITPKMREDILNNGLPMYRRGGEVHMAGGGLLKAIRMAQKAEKVEHPLVFPRAAAKTIEDIRPIAQRMAEQMTGEFVKQNPKVTTNPAGKSRKQFERERSIPLETRNLVPERAAPNLNYEDYMGHAIVGVPGDPTLGGVAKRGSLEEVAQPTVELTRVGDITPDHPVPLFGGPRYGDEDKFWASNFSAAVPVQNSANELAKLYEAPVLGKYIKMGSGSENFALHNLDALLSIQRPEKLDKAKMALLTEVIQAGSPKYGKFPGFTGFKDPADVLLQAQMDSNLRKHIAETLLKPTITQPLGLPNGLDVVAAITHPELRNLEIGSSGFSVGKLMPGAELKRGKSAHPTYDTDIPGSFIGRSKYPTPYEIAFPDTTAYARSKLTPGVQEFNMMKMLGPRERIDQQYIDEIKMYEDLMKQYTGKKKGGLAHTKKVKQHGNTVSN